jgi:hypothetical protein
MAGVRAKSLQWLLPFLVGFGSVAALIVGAPAAKATAPACRYTIGNDTVLDKETTLTWQRHLEPNGMMSAEADTYCANLPLEGGGWRVPTIQELLTLLDDSSFNPAMDTNAFPAAPYICWSSSPDSAKPVDRWFVDFEDGDSAISIPTNIFRVRCVR